MTRQRLVLVVDDEPAIRDLIQEALEGEGYQVVTAGDGAQAIRVLEHVSPDGIVLDLNMPIVDGWGFLEAYARQRAGHAPVVAISANMGLAEARLRALGVPYCVAKPFDLEQLLTAVTALVGAP